MATARDMITSALRLIRVAGAGRTLTASEAVEALAVFNGLLSSWSTERMMQFTTQTDAVPLLPGVGSYTIGPSGADVAAARPLRIEAAWVEEGGGGTCPLTLLNSAQWAAIAQKELSGSLPSALWYETSHPNGTLHLWPISTAGGLTLRFNSGQQLGDIASLDQVLSFPPGYERAFRLSLAMDLAHEYGVPVADDLRVSALEAKAKIKRANRVPSILRCDAAIAGRGRFDLVTGG